VDIADLEAAVSNIRANTVSENSRAAYRRSSIKFLKWLFAHKINLCTQECQNRLVGCEERTIDATIASMLNGAPNNPPIEFDTITARYFVTWIVTLRKAEGSVPGYSAYNCHRAAFLTCSAISAVTMSKQLETELRNHFKGLKRQTALSLAAGAGQIKVGKIRSRFHVSLFGATTASPGST
jgi:hypothetical protein